MTTKQDNYSEPANSRIFYGWWMVAITSAMAFFASGVFFRGFTVFVPAIRDSLGISQAQTNLVFSIARAEGGLEGPVAGWLIDRFGNKKLLIPALIHEYGYRYNGIYCIGDQDQPILSHQNKTKEFSAARDIDDDHLVFLSAEIVAHSNSYNSPRSTLWLLYFPRWHTPAS